MFRNGLVRMVLALIVLVITLGTRGQAAPNDRPNPPRIVLDGPEEIVFDPKHDACDRHDVPDVPPRAYRDAAGNVRMFALHFENRALVGPSLDALKPDCTVVFRGSGSADPAAYDDRSWITATWTGDGRIIHALVHHEYQAQAHPGRCAFKDYMACWFNTVLAARSGDGGQSFVKAARPVVASAPFPQTVEQGRHRGFFNPSNIVSDGVWHYMLASTTGWKGQDSGVCLFRTDTIADPSRWHAFDGTGFTIRHSDPYRGKTDTPPCMTLAPFPAPVGSVTRHTPSGQWIAVFQASQDRQRFPVAGIYAAASRDLRTWSEPRLVMATKTLYDNACGADYLNSYPTLIDRASASRNFETTGASADLYLSRMRVEGCNHTGDRVLVRMKVQIGVE
ncbi:MAG TPA: hypothetical protein PLQ11_06385 [Beijerinckiaceae bacterium]|nr:hypothetical protein [Beijerinckiaceae bacterium]